MNSFHRQASGYVNGEPYHEHHPADDLEPLAANSGELRETRLRYLEIISSWAETIHRAFCNDNATLSSIVPAFYGPAFALGLPCLNGAGMTDIADRFNVTRASISKQSTTFAESHGLPPSRYQKSEESRSSFSRSRIEQVKAMTLPGVPGRGRSV
jgi:hypothetical protein